MKDKQRYYNSASIDYDLCSYLDIDPLQYFSIQRRTILDIKENLKKLLDPNFEYFIVSNATIGLITLILATTHFNLKGINLHPPFKSLLEIHNSATNNQIYNKILSHVCPVTGNVIEDNILKSNSNIIDGSQSIGTYLQENLFENATTIIFSFHKNLGICLGLGCVAINPTKMDHATFAILNEYYKVFESGLINLGLLNACNSHLSYPIKLNTIKLQYGKKLLNYCMKNNLRVLTTSKQKSFIISFTTIDNSDIKNMINAETFSGRVFNKENIVRFSFGTHLSELFDPSIVDDLIITVLENQLILRV